MPCISSWRGRPKAWAAARPALGALPAASLCSWGPSTRHQTSQTCPGGPPVGLRSVPSPPHPHWLLSMVFLRLRRSEISLNGQRLPRRTPDIGQVPLPASPRGPGPQERWGLPGPQHLPQEDTQLPKNVQKQKAIAMSTEARAASG